MYIATHVPLPSQWRLPGPLSPPTYSPSQCPVQVLWGWSKSLLGFFHVTEKPKQALWPTQDFLGLPGWLSGKGSACNTGTQVRSLGWEDPLVEEMATHSNTPAWKIPLMEKPGAGYNPWVAKSRTRLSDQTELNCPLSMEFSRQDYWSA